MIHDYAVAGSAAIMDIIAACLREEERMDAMELFVAALEAMLQSYESERRLVVEPSAN